MKYGKPAQRLITIQIIFASVGSLRGIYMSNFDKTIYRIIERLGPKPGTKAFTIFTSGSNLRRPPRRLTEIHELLHHHVQDAMRVKQAEQNLASFFRLRVRSMGLPLAGTVISTTGSN